MTKPGGWGFQFSETECDLRHFTLDSHGAQELPLPDLSATVAPPKSKCPTVQMLESRGGYSAGIRATRDFVESTCRLWDIPLDFIRKVEKPGSLPWFSFLLEEGTSLSDSPHATAVNLCFRWGPGHSNFVLFFGRFDVQTSTLRAFLSSKEVLEFPTALELLNANLQAIQEHPLTLFAFFMESCERYVDTKAQVYNTRMLGIGRSLRVLDDEWLESWNIKPSKSANRSSAIYGAYDSANWLNKNCLELIAIGREYLKFAEQLEASGRNCSLPRDDVRDVVLRAELHAHMLAYILRMLDCQSSFYNNLLSSSNNRLSLNIAIANQRDSLSIKTVTYLTMVFLPATFVSAIFSTTVFDFQK